MSKKIKKKWRLSDGDWDDLQRALTVFTATVSEILECWFPELAGERWTISKTGIITVYES